MREENREPSEPGGSRVVENRLIARSWKPVPLKDLPARASGALNLGMLFRAQADTPAKLAAFAYASEHLEIAAYELLKRVASRAEDEQTTSAADEILVQEQAASMTCSTARSRRRCRKRASSPDAERPGA